MNSATQETIEIHANAARALRALGLFFLASKVEDVIIGHVFVKDARRAVDAFPASESRKAIYALRCVIAHRRANIAEADRAVA